MNRPRGWLILVGIITGCATAPEHIGSTFKPPHTITKGFGKALAESVGSQGTATTRRSE